MRRLGWLAVLLVVVGTPCAVRAGAPPTLYNLDRKVRFLSLAEARAIALEQRKLGPPMSLVPSLGIDAMVSSGEVGSLRVLAGGKSGSKSIVLTGVRRDPRPAEFERNVNQMLLNVENTYWNLYGSYWQLHSREQGLRRAYETWKIATKQFEDGKISAAAVAQAEGQYNLFRSQRLQAIDTVLDNERQLRAMLSLSIEDGTRLVPSDAPTLVEKQPDWKEGWHFMMKHRPELYLARQDVEKARIEVLAIKSFVVPVLRCLGMVEPPPSRSKEERGYPFRNARPIPERDPNLPACLQEPQLQLARAYLVLQDQELKAERYLGLWYRRTSSAYFQIKAAHAQRESFAKQLQIRSEVYRAGANEPQTGNPVTLSLLLEAQRFWTEALASECQAIVTYNNALCGWEFAKGDIMRYAHVRFGEEPCCGESVRAVEREHKRTRHKVVREPALQAESPLAVLDGEGESAPSLAKLWKTFPPLHEAGDLAAKTALIDCKASVLFPAQR
jgi:hypothetical protein